MPPNVRTRIMQKSSGNISQRGGRAPRNPSRARRLTDGRLQMLFSVPPPGNWSAVVFCHQGLMQPRESHLALHLLPAGLKEASGRHNKTLQQITAALLWITRDPYPQTPAHTNTQTYTHRLRPLHSDAQTDLCFCVSSTVWNLCRSCVRVSVLFRKGLSSGERHSGT